MQGARGDHKGDQKGDQRSGWVSVRQGACRGIRCEAGAGFGYSQRRSAIAAWHRHHRGPSSRVGRGGSSRHASKQSKASKQRRRCRGCGGELLCGLDGRSDAVQAAVVQVNRWPDARTDGKQGARGSAGSAGLASIGGPLSPPAAIGDSLSAADGAAASGAAGAVTVATTGRCARGSLGGHTHRSGGGEAQGGRGAGQPHLRAGQ